MFNPIRFLLLLFTLGIAAALPGQEMPANAGSVILGRISYGFQVPGGDLADRFGSNFALGGGLDYMTPEQNWIAGLDGQFLFGTEVKTDVLAGLRTPEGFIYGNNRSVADIQLRERGFYIGAHLGKLFSLSAVNPRSGLRLTLGAGLLQHKIRVTDDPVTAVPQLSNEYKKGYDRLSNGPALRQFIGYQLLGPQGRLNFYAGVELMQAFTRNRRAFNFDTRTGEAGARLDLLFGLRIGWILPAYLRKAEEIYY